MLRLITRAPIGRLCTKCGTEPDSGISLGELLLARWRVLRSGELLCPPCALTGDCLSFGHLPVVPTPCECVIGTDHPRALTGRCAVQVLVCRRCGEHVAPPRLPAEHKAVA